MEPWRRCFFPRCGKAIFSNFFLGVAGPFVFRGVAGQCFFLGATGPFVSLGVAGPFFPRCGGDIFLGVGTVFQRNLVFPGCGGGGRICKHSALTGFEWIRN